MCSYSGNTENGSIRRWAKLAGWLIDSQEFIQVVRSSRVEAIITEKREFVLYPWFYGHTVKRSKMMRNVIRFKNCQNKASSVAIIKTWKNKGRNRSLCGICGQNFWWWMELMWQSSKLAEHTRLETWDLKVTKNWHMQGNNIRICTSFVVLQWTTCAFSISSSYISTFSVDNTKELLNTWRAS